MCTVKQIDAKMLSKMFLAGAQRLEANKEWINELNVFPVPDGDTGTNMSLTMQSAVKEMCACQSSAFPEVCDSISKDGCILLEHHLETVEGSLPSCSASHFPVFLRSTSTTLSLLTAFVINSRNWFIRKDNDFFLFCNIYFL